MATQYIPLKSRTQPVATAWNHAFDLAFSLSGSIHEDWWGCLEDPREKAKLRDALHQRVNDLFGPDNEYREALSGFDTYPEEDN